MELSRRDALAALAAAGVGGAAVYHTTRDGSPEGSGGDQGDGEDGSDVLETAVALSAVVYPSDVSGRAEFVETYVTGRLDADDEYEEAMADAASVLDAWAREEYDDPFTELTPEEGDALLSGRGMEAVAPDPEGSDGERVRFYLVNELLYALLSSPKGGALVGIDNPPGYPGGLDAYQQGPQR